jgi:hypothetical protein
MRAIRLWPHSGRRAWIGPSSGGGRTEQYEYKRILMTEVQGAGKVCWW